MAIMEWEERFSVGVEQVDKHHLRLIKMINELHDAMVAKVAKEKVSEIADRMAEYAVSHFAYEEDTMVKVGYPGYERHKKQHEGFAEKVIELQTRIAAGEMVVSLEVIDFLREWLTTHICKSDKEYGPFFKTRGIQ